MVRTALYGVKEPETLHFVTMRMLCFHIAP